MAAIYQPSPSFDIGRVISRSFQIFARGFLPAFGSIFLFGLAFLLVAILILFSIGVGTGIAGGRLPEDDPTADMVMGLVGVGLVLLPIIMQYGLAVSAMTHVALGQEGMARPTFGDILGRGFAQVFPVTAVLVICGVMVGAASFFFLIPGIILGLYAAVAPAARAAEQTSVFGAIGRSFSLTEGSRALIFVTQIVFSLLVGMLMMFGFVMYGMIMGVASVAMGGSPGRPVDPEAITPVMIGMSLVTVFFISAFWTSVFLINAAFTAATYVECRTLREGPINQSAVFA